MAPSSKAIKNALVTLLDGLELGGEPAFIDVKGYPTSMFDGMPSVFVMPADQTTEKAAVSQNDRTVAFVITTHVAEKTDGSDYDYLYDLTDLIINALDNADYDDTFSATLGTYLLNASRGDWYKADTQAGPALIVDINVAISYSKDLA